MLTETEAKLKWCPFARDSDEHYGSFNRIRGTIMRRDENNKAILDEHNNFIYDRLPTEPAPTCLCLASACMAWQMNGLKQNQGYCNLMTNC